MMLLYSLELLGCLLPPERAQGPGEVNFGPEVELARLRPGQPLLTVNRDCRSINVEAGEVLDPDDSRLLFRWVANNSVQGTSLILDQVSDGEPATARSARWRIIPQDDFPEQWRRSETVESAGVLSLFVTDAPAWLEVEPDTSSRAPQDLGRVPAPASGPNDVVVEVRWTFIFTPEPTECGR
jgi:hypothetical protein